MRITKRAAFLATGAAAALVTLGAVPAQAADGDAPLSVLHGVPDLTVDVWVNDELALGGILWERRGSEPQEAPIASATLVALPDWPDARGEARVKEVDGHRQVVVDLNAPTSADGYREVWLIASDLSGLVSLGVPQGQEGRFDIPAGLDREKYSLVDVPEEHFDSDPTHSGDSIVCGPLEPSQA